MNAGKQVIGRKKIWEVEGNVNEQRKEERMLKGRRGRHWGQKDKIQRSTVGKGGKVV